MKERVTPKLTKRGRIIYMTDEDAAAFGDLLTASFPTIEFAVIRESERVIKRFHSLIEAIDYSRTVYELGPVYGWLAPRRWRPRWRLQWRVKYKGKFRAHYALTNLPPGWFTFPPNRGFKPFDPDAAVPVYTLFPYGQMLMTCYDLNDLEVRRFIDKVYRLLAKLVDNRYTRVIPETHEIVDRFKWDMFWAGRDAREVCRQRHDHYIWCGPLDSQGRRTFLKPYDWAPGVDKP